MRILPILTAIIVAAILYGLIMERERLQDFAGVTPQEDSAEVSEVKEIAARSGNEAVSVVVLRSRARPVQSGITVSGQTEAARKVDIRAETTGQVISEPIRKGASIAQGDILCELDPGTRQAQLTEAKARLREAKTNQQTAQKLAERGFSSETETISRQATLESATAAVEQAERELDRLTIVAPFDGVLETDTAELGALLQPGGACATLISLDPIHLVGFVPEQLVERLAIGSPAGARLVTGQELTGAVSFLSRSADEVTRTFRVEVVVPNTDLAIRDGVTAEIVIGFDAETGHLVPQSALTLNDDGILGVRLNQDGVATFRPVEIIRDSADGVWLTGLPEQAEIIVVGQDFVNEGRAINITYKDATE